MIDNTDKLKKVMTFEPNTYYKFVVLLREKDGKTVLQSYDKKELIVKQWLVDSEEKLTEMLPDMKTFTDMFHGRLYMTLDRKDVAKTMFYMQDKINAYIKQLYYGNRTEISVKQLNKLLASASSVSESSVSGDRKWLYDVDTKNKEVLKYVIERCGRYYLTTFETKNGYHVIAKREFNGESIFAYYNDYAFEKGLQMEFLTPENKPVVECKDNALTLVYMGD